MENQKIIVLGSTGQIGSATVRTLTAQHAKVTAGVRDLSKAKELENTGVSVIKADMSSSEQELASILSNFNVLFLVTPGHEDRQNLAINSIRAAKVAKMSYVLVLSIPSADNLNVLFGRQFNAIEKELKQSGLHYGIIRLPMFMDNIRGYSTSIRSQSTFSGPFEGGIRFVTVAVQDAALAAATILRSPNQHLNKTYTITSELLSFDEQALSYSKALGREIKYVNSSYDGTRKTLIGTMPEWQVGGLLEIYQLAEKKDPSQTTLSKDFTTITGKQPTTHLAWMTQFASTF